METEAHRKWREENKDKCKSYADRHRIKETAKKKQSEWKAANPDKVLATAARWRKKNADKQKAAAKKWRDSNREYINSKDRERCENDPSYRLARNLRCQLRSKLKQQRAGKITSAKNLVGCGIEFLMGYLEARFKPGMKWSTYGTVWEIDHRIPCSSFDLTDESHQRSCFHYTNLQPMFVSDNRKKWATMPATHQSELL